jgi:hypothetical protein
MSTFRGGVPYAIDIKRLSEAYEVPTLTEGRLLPHAELSAIISSPAGSGRYYAVCNSWMHKVKQSTGIFMVWEPKEGIRVLEPTGVLGFGETRQRQKLKQLARSTKHFAWVKRERLDEIGKLRLDKQLRVASGIRDFIVSTTREMAVELAPVRSLPKPQIVRDKTA